VCRIKGEVLFLQRVLRVVTTVFSTEYFYESQTSSRDPLLEYSGDSCVYILSVL